ncbi:bile salt-activated lipase-like [Megalops cyprinoides]|uniref:bile salt-activated lipase-like n=1 Tax=Megalops cyprinoides TaxID=118141 RepID=UPI001863A418|nr:bile salt-activated lipase-like [Megalops cyprinoides]
MDTSRFLAVLTLCLQAASAATLGVVSTEGGMVEGRNHRLGLFRSVDIFKGIPFAAPPGRFEKPKPHPGWSGVLKATKFRERCLQVTLLQTGTQGSEDCLYLNIWVPQGRTVSTGLPVMVYIFGGAFLLGASNDVSFMGNSLYDGEEIADRGKVIVITVNYRVGTLGFLSTGDASGPGNYGLWDQHAAISWVHRNIRAFGGDPSSITIFGQSAGAASVSFQMLSPYNKGVIRRAISQCGVALSPWALQKKPLALAQKVAQTVGCPTQEGMMGCLKITDPVALTKAGKLALEELGDGPVVFSLELSPVVDGDFIPDLPSRLFHNTAHIDYIAGTNDMDGHLFAGMDVPSINQNNKPTYPEDIRRLLAGLTAEKGEPALNSSYSTYTRSWVPQPDQDTIKKTVVDIETDYLFLVPTQTALYLHEKNARGARSYSYVFSMPTRIPGFPRWMGSDHAEDVQYVFGKPFSTPLAYLPRHRDVSAYLIAYWTNFARTGDPNQGESQVPATWPAFTSSGRHYLDINNKISKDSVKRELRTRFVHYWTSTYASLPTPCP